MNIVDIAKEFVSTFGWTLVIRRRNRLKRLYVYAAQHTSGVWRERYIAPMTRLEAMSREDIEARILEVFNR